jgi:3-phenylpropionate/trans-cinnamate dioxygenase ferredoxin reductase subunit
LPAAQAEVPGVFTLRTIEDCHAIAQRLTPGKRLLVIGGGWIGLEVCATARSKGVDVTLLETGERLCARSVSPLVSQFLLERHRSEGAEVRLGAAVRSICLGDAGRLAIDIDGTVASFDTVVVGIGLVPNTHLALDCGLEVSDGIVVTAHGQTSDAHIFATGDVANQPCTWAGGRVRLESWANAQNHAIAVGRAIAGAPSLHEDIPWFWSDQYDFNLQVLGIPSLDAEEVVRGDTKHGSFSVFQLLNGTLRSVLSVNSPRDVSVARRWMKRGECPAREVLADPSQRLDRV